MEFSTGHVGTSCFQLNLTSYLVSWQYTFVLKISNNYHYHTYLLIPADAFYNRAHIVCTCNIKILPYYSAYGRVSSSLTFFILKHLTLVNINVIVQLQVKEMFTQTIQNLDGFFLTLNLSQKRIVLQKCIFGGLCVWLGQYPIRII